MLGVGMLFVNMLRLVLFDVSVLMILWFSCFLRLILMLGLLVRNVVRLVGRNWMIVDVLV